MQGYLVVSPPPFAHRRGHILPGWRICATAGVLPQRLHSLVGNLNLDERDIVTGKQVTGPVGSIFDRGRIRVRAPQESWQKRKYHRENQMPPAPHADRRKHPASMPQLTRSHKGNLEAKIN